MRQSSMTREGLAKKGVCRARATAHSVGRLCSKFARSFASAFVASACVCVRSRRSFASACVRSSASTRIRLRPCVRIFASVLVYSLTKLAPRYNVYTLIVHSSFVQNPLRYTTVILYIGGLFSWGANFRYFVTSFEVIKLFNHEIAYHWSCVHTQLHVYFEGSLILYTKNLHPQK